MSLSNLVLPSWSKYVAYAVLITATWGHGYVKGINHAANKAVAQDTRIIIKQGKVTTKVITKYIKIKEKQTKLDGEIKNDGTSYAINFSDDPYRFNNEYVRVFDNSVTGIPSLPSGNPGDPTDVTVSRQLSVSVNNNIVARYWKHRAEFCEEWAKEQESVK